MVVPQMHNISPDQTIYILNKVVSSMPCSYPHRYAWFLALARAVGEKYDNAPHAGVNHSDLDQSICHYYAGLAIMPQSHPIYFASLHDLAVSLVNRYSLFGEMRDLLDAISHFRKILRTPNTFDLQSSALNSIGAALFSSFERKGQLLDLKECIAAQRWSLRLRPTPDASRCWTLINLSTSLSTYAEHTGDGPDLEEAIKLSREALQVVIHGSFSAEVHSASAKSLASCLSRRFQRKRSRPDLEQAIALLRKAVDIEKQSGKEHFSSLSNLATALRSRYGECGDIVDLQDTISLEREALNRMPFLHPNRALCVHNLSSSLQMLFACKGGPEHLDEAINIDREYLKTRPSPHPSRFISLSSLSSALEARFMGRGSIQDLEESLVLNEEAVSTMDRSHPDYVRCLEGIAIQYGRRFEYRGDQDDLARSISWHRFALSAQDSLPSSLTDFSDVLNNLGGALLVQMTQAPRPESDLEEAITLLLEALSRRPLPTPRRATTLCSLTIAYRLKFEKQRDLQDIERAVECGREGLAIIDQMSSRRRHPDRTRILINLAPAISERYRQTGDPNDLEESIRLSREALESLPHLHPHRAPCLKNLAISIRVRFEKKQEHHDLKEASELYRQAATCQTGNLLNRLTIARDWAAFEDQYGLPSTLEAFQCAIDLLPQGASLDLSLQQRKNILTHSKNLVSDATACAIKNGEFDKAVEFSFTARSVFWSQAMRLRSPLDNLDEVNGPLAKRFRTVSQILENASFFEPDQHLPSSTKPFWFKGSIKEESGVTSSRLTYHSLANEWEDLLSKIREIPGFESVLKPYHPSSIKDATKRGPIILLNAESSRCDALIVTSLEVLHVPLSRITHERVTRMAVIVRHDVNGRAVDLSDLQLISRGEWDERKFGPRKEGRKGDSRVDPLEHVLKILWKDVVQPILSTLGWKKSENPNRLWWYPTGVFTLLPLHAAGIYSGEVQESLQDFAISSYCSSLQDLLRPPIISEKSKQPFKMMVVIQPNVPPYGKLPYTKEELHKIKGRLPTPNDQYIIEHVGSEESLTTVEHILSDLPKVTFVHFGCHGIQNEHDPLKSALLLNGGRLTMADIVRCKREAGDTLALAYLSACHTATGDLEQLDQSMHLVAAVMFAGFRGVVGTLWSIVDEDGPIVADVFYDHILRHVKSTSPDVTEAARALHLAVAELRARKASFKRWVPFVHFGL